MNQSRLTDFFNASRKNVTRNRKKCIDSPTVVKESPCVESRISVKRTTYEKESNASTDEEPGRPAFKRFRHLVTNSDEIASTSTEKSPRTSHHGNRRTKGPNVNSITTNEKNMIKSDTPMGVIENVSNRVKYSERMPCNTTLSTTITEKDEHIPKNSSEKVPAYQKFAHLVSTASKTVEESTEIGASVLPLPYLYKNLVNFFKAMDNVVNIMYNRKELLSFTTLRDSVQKVLRKDFNEQTFGRIKSLYMGSFSTRYEKNIPKFGRKASANYELIVDVNLIEDETVMSASEETKMVYNGTRLVQRREKFVSKIMALLFMKHKEFLCKDLNLLPSEIPENAKLKRWHPRFSLEKVEAPEAMQMPPRPDGKDKRIISAKEAVDMFREKGLIKESRLCERVAVKCSIDGKTQTPENQESKNSYLRAKKRQTQLRGLPTSLLEKIRAKETAKLAKLNHGGPEWEKKQIMLSRLPDLAIHTWNLFATNRKPVLSVSYLCEKIADSHSSGLSESSVRDHLHLLSESLPEWFELLKWKIPHARILDMKRNLADIRGNLMKLRDTS